MHLAIFLDLLTPIKVLRLTTQQEEHDPVNNIKRINKFQRNIVEFSILISNTLDEGSKRLTNVTKLLKVTDNREYKV